MHVKLVDFGLAKEVLPNTRSRYRINYAKIKLTLFQFKLIFGLVGLVIFHLHQTFKNSLIPFKLRFGLVGTMEFMSPEVRLVFSKIAMLKKKPRQRSSNQKFKTRTNKSSMQYQQ